MARLWGGFDRTTTKDGRGWLHPTRGGCRRIAQGETSHVSFERLFHPRGIAIIGASADLSRISGQPIKALKGAGYAGRIFPVNPKYPQMHGLKCYPDAASIGEPCDLGIVAVPAQAVA